jgi:hypothetical protein
MKIVFWGIIVLIAIAALIGVIGFFLPEEKSASGEYVYDFSNEVVWNKMRDLEGQKAWRKNLESIDILDNSLGKELWIENLKSGAQIKLRTTFYIDKKAWGMQTYDSSILVYWKGELESLDKQKTLIKFHYDSKISNPFMRVMSLFFLNLQEMIQTYNLELQNALNEGNLRK